MDRANRGRARSLSWRWQAGRAQAGPTISSCSASRAAPQQPGCWSCCGCGRHSACTAAACSGSGWKITWRPRPIPTPLTGLANRRLFRQLLASRLGQPDRGPVAVLFADLDDFKSVNDTQGHADGDRLLAEVGDRIGELLHDFPESVAARLGGDEFAILLPETPEYAAESLAGRFVTSLGRPYAAAPQVPVTVSVALALSGLADDDPGVLLRSADLAMYAAKEGGRDRWVRYVAEMHTALVERVELEGELRQGLLRGELVLHYQPMPRPRSR